MVRVISYLCNNACIFTISLYHHTFSRIILSEIMLSVNYNVCVYATNFMSAVKYNIYR